MHTTTSQPLPPQRHHAPELHGAFADDGNPRTDNTTWYRSEDLPNRTAPLVDRSSHPHPHPYGKEPLFVAVNPFRASSARGWGRVARPVHLVAPSPVAVDIPEIPFPDDMPQTSSVAFRRRIRRARAGSRAQHDILPAAAVIHTQPLPANRFYGFTANVEPGPLPPPRSRSSSPTSSTPSPSVLAVPSASAHSIASDNPPPASRHTRSSPRHRSRSRSRSIRGFVHERESRSRRRRGSRSRSRTPPISMHGRESRSRSPRRSSTSIICMRESRSRSQSIKTPPPSAMEGSYPRSHRPPVPPVIVAGDPRSRDRTPPPVLKSHRSRSRSPRWISAEQEAQGFRWVPDRPLGIHTSHEITDLPPSEGLPVPATSKKASRLNIYLALQTVVLIACAFVFDSAPRRLYLHFLLRIPSLYFSRVARIFEDAQLSLPDIKRMARATADQWNTKESPTMFLAHHDQMMLPRSLLNFRSSWEGFIDSLMREWKTLNIISVLLLSAILTMLQIDAAANPITRTSALFSLICALMSLLYGCMYIIRFGTMRKMHKASSFANEAQKDTTNIWWNVWVLLAMPAIWLSWSIIMFFMSIMSFIWLSGTADDPVGFTMSSRAALGPRIGLTVVFSLGLIYFALIVKTFHRYGDALDREWMRTVNEWTREGSYTAPRWYRPAPPRSHHTPPRTIDGHLTPTKVVLPTQWTADNAQHVSRAVSPTSSRHERKRDFFKLPPSSPLTTHPSVFFATPNGPESSPPPSFDPITTMQLGYPDAQAYVMAHLMPAHIVKPEIWNRFMTACLPISCPTI
ncbi:hypothetical protein B0H10DRAFT_1346548 [Mycena sp. CBHHK59/15]|nr:hypothetical protein B0H10DRAFT_1346548 [Mycena sp. CBHHK59/15]